VADAARVVGGALWKTGISNVIQCRTCSRRMRHTHPLRRVCKSEPQIPQ
jgi:hypothetical protein